MKKKKIQKILNKLINSFLENVKYIIYNVEKKLIDIVLENEKQKIQNILGK